MSARWQVGSVDAGGEWHPVGEHDETVASEAEAYEWIDRIAETNGAPVEDLAILRLSSRPPMPVMTVGGEPVTREAIEYWAEVYGVPADVLEHEVRAEEARLRS